MKTIVQLFTLSIFIIGLSSCSDEKSTTPTEEVSYDIPLSIGNWWKYETYSVDENGIISGSSLSEITHSIIGKIEIAGKDAFLRTDNEDGTIDTTYIYLDDNGLYSYSEPGQGSSTGLWVKTIDFKNTNWDIYKFDIDEEDEENGTSSKGISGMKGEKIASSTVTYKGKSYNVQNYYNIVYSDIINTYVDENDELVSEQQINSDTTYVSFIPGLGIYSSSNLEYNYINGELIKSLTKDILIDHNIN